MLPLTASILTVWDLPPPPIRSPSRPGAAPAQGRHHRVDHRPGPRVVPEVPYLRPLDLRVDAGLLQAHRLVHPEVGRERFQDVGPEALLLRGADHAEADLVDRVVGTGEGLDLGDRRAALVGVRREGVPARLGVAFRGHDREGLVVGVDHAHPRVDGHAADGRAYEQHLARCYARHRGVEPAVRRLELGETLLPDAHGLLWRRLRAGQAYPVGLLPELAEALQGADLPPPVHVHVGGPVRHVRDFEPLYPLRPEGGVARLLLALLLRWRGSFRHGLLPS